MGGRRQGRRRDRCVGHSRGQSTAHPLPSGIGSMLTHKASTLKLRQVGRPQTPMMDGITSLPLRIQCSVRGAGTGPTRIPDHRFAAWPTPPKAKGTCCPRAHRTCLRSGPAGDGLSFCRWMAASSQLLVRAASMSRAGTVTGILIRRDCDMGSGSGTLARCDLSRRGLGYRDGGCVQLGHDTTVSDRTGPRAPMATRQQATRRQHRRVGRRGPPYLHEPMTGQ